MRILGFCGNFFTPEETSVNPSFSGVTVTVKAAENVTPGENTGGNAGGSTGSGESNTGGTGGNTGSNIGGGTGSGSGSGSGTGTGTGSGQTGGNQSGTGGFTGNNTGTSGGTSTGGNTGTTINPPVNNNTGTGNNTSNNQQKSSNNNLKSLQLDVEGISPVFNKNKTQYYITISENILNINITAIPEDSKASVQVLGNTNIQIGNSQIKIIVTAENGNNKEYLINVTKTNNLELANANLENLAIENVTLIPEFSANITDYTAEFSTQIDKLNILAVPQQEEATVTIEGNENLQIGDNFIKVTVLAKDGKTSKVYNITVKKNENVIEEVENNSLNNIEQNNVNNENVENIMKSKVENNNILWIVAIILLAIFIIIVIVIFIKKHK